MNQENSGRRARKTAETRERIFRAAIELFAVRGISQVTVEQITDHADVGKGTFFNYFLNKEAVLNYFGGNQVERLQEAFGRGEIQGTPRERLEQLLDLLACHPSWTKELARGLFIASLSHAHTNQLDERSVWHIHGIVAEIIREGQECGDFRTDISAPEAAHVVFGQHFLALLNWCTGFSEESLVETSRRFVRIGLDGLAARA